MDLDNIYGNDTTSNSNSSCSGDDNNTGNNTGNNSGNSNGNGSNDSTACIYLTDLNMFILRVTLWTIKPDTWFHEQLLSYRTACNITTTDTTISWDDLVDFFTKWIALIVKRELKELRYQISKEIWKNIKTKSINSVTKEVCKKKRVVVPRVYRRPLDC
jgi:hypothetical protein